MKKIIILGSTGSIGSNTLDVINHLDNQFDVIGISCRNSVDKLEKQIIQFAPKAAAATGDAFDMLRFRDFCKAQGTAFYEGETGLLQMLEDLDADIVLNGISGSRGLMPSLKTLEKGTDLALANKETAVMAGSLILEIIRTKDVKLIPVDSEHFAIFSLLQKVRLEDVDRIILTASGGAFRDLPYDSLKKVRLKDALKHPNYAMGPKITIDSATMANKGLEFIEAHTLFNWDVSRIEVLIHPQSYVHGLIRMTDGFYYAQISTPDMRMAIQDALTFPELHSTPFGTLDLLNKELCFYPVDRKKYRMFYLAVESAEKEGIYPIVYNAANEVALEYFMKERLKFIDIPIIVEETLRLEWKEAIKSIEDILAVDDTARCRANIIAKKREVI